MMKLGLCLTIAAVLAGLPGRGTTATRARAAGPGQRQLGPPAGHGANHATLTACAAGPCSTFAIAARRARFLARRTLTPKRLPRLISTPSTPFKQNDRSVPGPGEEPPGVKQRRPDDSWEKSCAQICRSVLPRRCRHRIGDDAYCGLASNTLKLYRIASHTDLSTGTSTR